MFGLPVSVACPLHLIRTLVPLVALPPCSYLAHPLPSAVLPCLFGICQPYCPFLHPFPEPDDDVYHAREAVWLLQAFPFLGDAARCKQCPRYRSRLRPCDKAS